MLKFQFNDEVHDYQRFVRENIKVLGNMLLITEQLYIENIDTCILDMLLLNMESKRLVIVELKNVLAKDRIIWQPIKYYDYLRRTEDSLRQLLILKQNEINFNIDDIDFNPEILLVVPDFNQQLLRSLSYFNDINIKVIKFNMSLDGQIIKEDYIPSSIYHKEDLVTIKEKVSKVWDFNEYKKEGVNSDKIGVAKELIDYLKSLLPKDKKLDLFFYNKYITLMIGDKVWGHIMIKNQIYRPYLTIEFKYNKSVNSSDFMFATHIVDYKLKDKSIVLSFYKLPTDLIKKYLIF